MTKKNEKTDRMGTRLSIRFPGFNYYSGLVLRKQEQSHFPGLTLPNIYSFILTHLMSHITDLRHRGTVSRIQKQEVLPQLDSDCHREAHIHLFLHFKGHKPSKAAASMSLTCVFARSGRAVCHR